MKIFFKIFQSNKVSAIMLALFILGLWYWGTSTEERALRAKQEISSTKGVTNTKVKPLSERTPDSKNNAPEMGKVESAENKTEKFYFEREVKKVEALVRQWPASRGELLEVVVKADRFKELKKPMEPHSYDEIQQNQMGAVKVLALRELISQSRDVDSIKKDLEYIVQRAQDPTIVKIANAAKESLEKGRSFFDDFVGGIESLEFE